MSGGRSLLAAWRPTPGRTAPDTPAPTPADAVPAARIASSEQAEMAALVAQMRAAARQAGLDDDVVFEIENPLEILKCHVEQQTNTARQRFEEPDMRHR